MALRVKCKCGKSLKISSQLAGKKLRCPGCSKPFRISPEKFKAAARARAAKAAASPTNSSATAKPTPAARPPAPQRKPTITPAPLAPASSGATDAGPIELDLSGTYDFSQSDLLSDFESQAATAETSAAAMPAVIIETEDAQDLGYAGETGPRRRSARDAIEDPKRTFWRDAFFSFVYPFSNAGNAINFFIICVFAVINVFLATLGCFGLIGSLIIFGWLAALYLSVTQDTAAGSDDMPGIRMEHGILDDIVIPAFKYLGAYATAFAPALLTFFLIVAGPLPQSAFWSVFAWIALGAFMCPMILLLFSFGAFGSLARLDLIFATIFRTFVPYIAMWVMLLITFAIYMLTALAPFLMIIGFEDTAEDIPEPGLAMSIFFAALDPYARIVGMRVVGLYYRHHKRRFAIQME